tara:strand:- start:2136 stop:2390 length:255 start_codon:yes stop_codon:yes gene_type:complete
MKIDKMTKGSWGKIRAYFSVEVSGFTMKGFKLIEGMNGLFAAPPSQKDEDGKYNNTVFIEKETLNTLTKMAIKEYGADSGTMPF